MSTEPAREERDAIVDGLVKHEGELVILREDIRALVSRIDGIVGVFAKLFDAGLAIGKPVQIDLEKELGIKPKSKLISLL